MTFEELSKVMFSSQIQFQAHLDLFLKTSEHQELFRRVIVSSILFLIISTKFVVPLVMTLPLYIT